jgi:hypothetical protein
MTKNRLHKYKTAQKRTFNTQNAVPRTCILQWLLT